MFKRSVCVFLFVLAVFSLPSCALFDVRETVTYGHNSKPVPEEVINGIRIHKTTRDWVLENVGEPDEINQGHNTSEIFTYRFEEYRTQRVRVFLLFSFRKNVIDEKHVYVHFVGGIVHKFWRDYELPAVPADDFDVARPEPQPQSNGYPRSAQKPPMKESPQESQPPGAATTWSEPLDPLSEDIERY